MTNSDPATPNHAQALERIHDLEKLLWDVKEDLAAEQTWGRCLSATIDDALGRKNEEGFCASGRDILKLVALTRKIALSELPNKDKNGDLILPGMTLVDGDGNQFEVDEVDLFLAWSVSPGRGEQEIKCFVYGNRNGNDDSLQLPWQECTIVENAND